MKLDSNGLFTMPVRVYFEDTDAGGIVYHASYIRFFERARTEYLRQLQVTQSDLFMEQTGFVVRHMDIDWLQMGALDSLLTIHSQIIERKNTSFSFTQEAIDENGAVLCKAKVLIVCIDTQKGKPKKIPDFITSN